jgi:hypothetical protein
MDYEQPDLDRTGCEYWTWLEPSCYTNITLTAYHISPQQELSREMNSIDANGLGHFQRVWISLDELFACFDPTTGFCGYSKAALGDLDDALARIAAAHQKVDLVLFADSGQSSFNYKALDGYHPQMEANYVTALQQFVDHVAANPTDSSVIAVMDLFNEGYYQIDSYLEAMPNVCGRDGGCIDHNISRPFLLKLYDAAHTAAPHFLYTVSSTANLLGIEQSRVFPLYAGIADVYDIHLYSGGQTRPGDATSYLANAKNLTKPWFVGEAGCATASGTRCSYDGGNINCTLPAACSLSIDTWWLENLRSYGASAVLVQNAATVFSSSTLIPSLVGQQVIKANAPHGS